MFYRDGGKSIHEQHGGLGYARMKLILRGYIMYTRNHRRERYQVPRYNASKLGGVDEYKLGRRSTVSNETRSILKSHKILIPQQSTRPPCTSAFRPQ